MKVDGIESLNQTVQVDGGQRQVERVVDPGKPGSFGSFLDAIQSSVENVNQQQQQADLAIKELLAGRNKNIHETVLAVERADISLKLMMQIRNKILDAYREVMRMQV